MEDFGRRRVTLKLTERMLGTAPKDRDVYSRYIATRKAERFVDEKNKYEVGQDDITEEVETVPDTGPNGGTGFHRDDDGLFVFDYMVKGFLKSAFEVSMEFGAIQKVQAYKKWLDLLVFIWPRRIHLGCQEPDGVLERPLRTMTPKGPRVALTRSGYVDAGRELVFDVEILKNNKGITWDDVEQAFDYGRYVGLGQWRGSGGYGRFELVGVNDAMV